LVNWYNGTLASAYLINHVSRVDKDKIIWLKPLSPPNWQTHAFLIYLFHQTLVYMNEKDLWRSFLYIELEKRNQLGKCKNSLPENKSTRRDEATLCPTQALAELVKWLSERMSAWKEKDGKMRRERTEVGLLVKMEDHLWLTWWLVKTKHLLPNYC